jgi:type IV secretion system protein VirD4
MNRIVVKGFVGLAVLCILICGFYILYSVWLTSLPFQQEGAIATFVAHYPWTGISHPLTWFVMTLMGIIYIVISIDGKTRTGTTHGSARFATRAEARRYTHTPLLWTWVLHHITGQQTPPTSRLALGTYRGLTISLSERQQESNLLVTAPVGSGKSSLVIIPNLLQEHGSRSLFIADLKGDLYNLTAGAVAQHHQVWVFAPTHAENSHGYNPLAHIHTIEDAQDFADVWVSNTGEGEASYWANNARLLISALVMHLRTVERNAPFSRLSDLVMGMSFEEIKKLLCTSPSLAARREAQGFLDHMSRNKRLTSNIMTDIGNRFQALIGEEVRKVTAIDEIDFDQMVDEPIAFYLSIPRNATRRLQPIMACLTMQMFTSWERRAERSSEHALPRGMACYLDEFTNIGHIPGFVDFISSARSKRIALLMATQSFSQLKACYGKEGAETIKNNAVTHLLLQGAGLQETRYYSKRIGNTTVVTGSSTSEGFGIGTQRTWTQGKTQRRLLTPEELRTMRDNTILMLRKASPPMLLKGHPYYRDRHLKRLARLHHNIVNKQLL